MYFLPLTNRESTIRVLKLTYKNYMEQFGKTNENNKTEGWERKEKVKETINIIENLAKRFGIMVKNKGGSDTIIIVKNGIKAQIMKFAGSGDIMVSIEPGSNLTGEHLGKSGEEFDLEGYHKDFVSVENENENEFNGWDKTITEDELEK